MPAYLFNNDFMITEAGEINARYIKIAAKARAQSKYGFSCSKSDIADYEVKLQGLAEVQREKFRDGSFRPADPFQFYRQTVEVA